MSQLDRYLQPPDPWECEHDEPHADQEECEEYDLSLREDAAIEAADARRKGDDR